MYPKKCQSCYKYHHHTVDKNCPLCCMIAFSEHILCDLLREGHDETQTFECQAFRPNLSLVVGGKPDSAILTEPEVDDTSQTSPQTQRWKDKWFLAYAKQQLQFYPDQIIYELKFHLCLTTQLRRQLLADTDQYFASLAEVVHQSSDQFEWNAALLAMGADHLHIYINSTPDDVLEDIVRQILTVTEQGSAERFPELYSSPAEPLFNDRYFIETIGR